MKIERGQILYKTGTAFGQSPDIGIYALASVINDLAAEGVRAFCAEVQIFLPVHMHNSHVYSIEKRIKKTCAEYGVELSKVQTVRLASVTQCMVIVTGISRAPKEEAWYRETMRAGQDIVLTKWAGMEGMLRIVSERETELGRRFAPVFLQQIRGFQSEVFALREIDIARACGVSAIRQIGEGGIFAALWRLAREAETGLKVDMKRISVKQETIEICEYFRINPYQLASAGSLLMLSDDGKKLTDALLREGIPASVIGSFEDNNDKIITNGEETRYIDRPAPDELNKIFMEVDYERDSE